MGHLEGNFTPVLCIGRKVLNVKREALQAEIGFLSLYISCNWTSTCFLRESVTQRHEVFLLCGSAEILRYGGGGEPSRTHYNTDTII